VNGLQVRNHSSKISKWRK